MKKLFVFLAIALTGFLYLNGMANSEPINHEYFTETKVNVVSGYFDVYIVNKCSNDIRVTIRGNGASQSFYVNGGDKEKTPVKAGYELYVDGDKIQTFSDGDSGDEFVICD